MFVRPTMSTPPSPTNPGSVRGVIGLTVQHRPLVALELFRTQTTDLRYVSCLVHR